MPCSSIIRVLQRSDGGAAAAHVGAFVLGLGMLLVYSFALNLIPYLAGEYARTDFPFIAALALTYPALAVQFIMLPVGHWAPSWLRIRGAILLNLIILAVLPSSVPAGIAAGTLLLVLSGVATSVMESSLFGYWSAFPPSFNRALVAGQGMAGVIASLISICVRVSLPSEPRAVALIYCGVGAAAIGGCLAVDVLVARLPYVAAVMARASDGMEQGAEPGLEAASGTKAGAVAQSWGEGGGHAQLTDPWPSAGASAGDCATASPLAVSSAAAALHRVRELALSGGGPDLRRSLAGPSSPGCPEPPSPLARVLEREGQRAIGRGPTDQAVDAWNALCTSCASMLPAAARAWAANFARVLRVVQLPALALCINFISTFLPFPGLLASVPYRGDAGVSIAAFASDGWWFTALLFFYGVCDVLGRFVAGWHRPTSDATLLLYSGARLLWTPAVAACARGWAGASDAAIVAVVAGFALTNGHVATLCFMQGPTKASGKDRELAGFAMAAALHVGIVLGSNLALAIFAL